MCAQTNKGEPPREPAGARLFNPDIFNDSLEVTDVQASVHQGRQCDRRSKSGAVMFEAIGSVGERDGFIDILVFGRRDEFIEACGVENRCGDAIGVSVTAEGDDGHAHIESLAGGESAVVREGVKGDIDVGVLLKVIGAEGTELDAVGIDADMVQPLLDDGASRGNAACFRFDDQLGVADAVKDCFPKLEHSIRYLSEVIERPERDVLVLDGRDVRHVFDGRVAQMAIGHEQKLFCEVGRRRRREFIGQEEIDGVEPR